MNKCNKCNKDFKARAKKVGCGLCGKWFHAEKCAEISNEEWEVLSKSEQIYWYCQACNTIAPEVLLNFQKCVKDNIEIKKDVIDMKKEMKDLKECKDEQFIEAVKKLALEVVMEEKEKQEEDPRPEAVESIRAIARKEVHENNDKKGREANIVVSNVDEDKDTEKEIQEILTFLDVTVNVEGIRRMGKERQEDRNRAIWVQLGNKKERNMVLEKAKKLRAEEKWKHVFINKDMTEAERKEAYLIRVELREKRQAEGNLPRSKFVIHRGRVIHKDQYGRERRTVTEGIPNPAETEDTDAETDYE